MIASLKVKYSIPESGSRANTKRDRIRCYKCREYDHFTKDCPANKIEKEINEIEQMYNMYEYQTSLKALATDTYDSLNRIDSLDGNSDNI